MKVNASHRGDQEKTLKTRDLNASTVEAYIEQADKISGRLHLAPEQRKRIEENKYRVAQIKEANAKHILQSSCGEVPPRSMQ